MGTRIGAALMIVVAAFLMVGIKVSDVFGMPDIVVAYTIAASDGTLVPLVVD